MEIRDFGKLEDGRNAGLYVLRNSRGMIAAVSDYGATLVKLIVPSKNDTAVDVVMGYDDVTGYERGTALMGSTVGRYVNRIRGGRFSIDGKTYELYRNDGENTNHSGKDYYGKRMWEAKVPFVKVNSKDIQSAFSAESMNDERELRKLGDNSIMFCLESPDGDQGFPGNLHVEVTYALTDENALHIDYRAVADADTAINLTNHSYFNLAGHGSGQVLDHIVKVNAEAFTVCDEQSVTTGEIRSVEGTPFDFREPKMLGRDIDSDYKPLVSAGGYDLNYVLEDADGCYREAAELFCEETGIHMTVLTDLPGMQLYTANYIKGEQGKGGAYYPKRGAVCFETQYFPDAVNKEHFPGGILRAGEVYHSRTTFKFDK